MQVKMGYAYRVFIILVIGVGIGALSSFEVSASLIEVLLYILVLSAGLSMGGLWAERGIPSGRTALQGFILGISLMLAGGVLGYIIGGLMGFDPVLTWIAGLASGWYSLAGPLVSLYDPVVGLSAFTANLLREVLHIGFYPYLAKGGYRCEGVSLGGATTMDTGLPVVIKYGGLDASMVALSQGLVITALAPIIASLLLY